MLDYNLPREKEDVYIRRGISMIKNVYLIIEGGDRQQKLTLVQKKLYTVCKVSEEVRS